jgi:hypothetical protein
MRTSRTAVLLVAAALVLAGCSDDASPDADPTSQSAEPTATPSATETAEPTDAPTEEPTATEEPTEEPTQEPAAPVTELPATVLLPAAALFPEDGPRTEFEGLVDWTFPVSCAVGGPESALVMQSVSQGDGTFEVPVGHHQVAVFADADAAVAEVDRITAALGACAGVAPDGQTHLVTETVEVGAQGIALVVDYYGALEANGDEGTLGYVTAVTRRGNAVTLVSSEGGESSVGASRERVVGELEAAWDLLCGYDSAGC